MAITLQRIQRFPIKGLSAEQMPRVTLTPGSGVPGDRMFGFARHGSGFDPANPQPLPKDRFVVLLTQAALAGLKTQFDPETRQLEIAHADAREAFDMTDEAARDRAGAWLSTYIGLMDVSDPQFVSAFPHRFTDVSVVSPQMMHAVSILNLSSVRDLATRLDRDIDPARFRANLEIDGLPPGWELEHIGETLRLGDVSLRLIKRTKRCAATEVNPVTAERDLKLPYLLRKEFGHMDMGVYAEVVTGGVLQSGQKVSIAG
ncbi:MOSC domain-containing protein [Tateyamaria armeniaca]|uniref:MOSC domain-containing protein n=1 Tax=Tateyamaria armeniaca TaxID=2518930 RepID=A0ABW8UR47_9RHOB